MTKMFAALAIGLACAIAFSACGSKEPTKEIAAAEAAISAAKAGQVNAANPDLVQAEEILAKAKAEISAQLSGAVKDFTMAKKLLAEAKSLSEKALADHKSGADGKNVSKADPPRTKS